MRLFIAEKPSLGRSIAEGIGIKSKGDGYINCTDGSVITWAFGHLLELADPKIYNPEYEKWVMSALPIVPDVMKKEVKNDSGIKKQFNIIKGLINKATEIVNAGDPDREGQLLIDEILEFVGNKKPVKRILLSATDIKSVKKALSDLRDNKDFHNLKMAAESRSEADWLHGINMTRAMTLTLKAQGGGLTLSIGRVQTPTLNLVVERELTIKNFVPRDYFICQAQLKGTAGGSFWAKFLPEYNDNLGGDNEGYLIDKAIAQRAIDNIQSKAVLTQCQVADKKSVQPAGYALSSLQKEASSKLGFGAKQTLDVAQNLYEAGLTSYPRSDCNFLPEEQLDDAGTILASLSAILPIAKKADKSIRSPIWNTKKVTAHHAIIPTTKSPSGLNGDEMALYMLIAKKYIAQFFEPELYQSVAMTIEDAGSQKWKASGKVVKSPGWTVVYGNEQSDEEQAIPILKEGIVFTCENTKLEASKTKPPARFTEGTLVSAMSSIQEYVKQKEYKAILKETSGIGTEATRASIIEVLIKRGYIKKDGKSLVPSDIAIAMIGSLTPKLKDPAFTAMWEIVFKDIESGKRTYEEFIREQKRMLPILLEDVKSIRFAPEVITTTKSARPNGYSKSKTTAKKTYKKRVNQ